MILAAPLLLSGHGELAWTVPAGWADLPPPSRVALVIGADGRVLGRCRRVPAEGPELQLIIVRGPAPMEETGQEPEPVMRRLVVCTAACMVFGQPGGGGRPRSHRWRAFVARPNDPYSPSLTELCALTWLGFERE